MALEIEYLKKDYNRSLSQMKQALDSKYRMQYMEKDHQKTLSHLEEVEKIKFEFIERERIKTLKMVTTMLTNMTEL